jgi:hypothetical protein
MTEPIVPEEYLNINCIDKGDSNMFNVNIYHKINSSNGGNFLATSCRTVEERIYIYKDDKIIMSADLKHFGICITSDRLLCFNSFIEKDDFSMKFIINKCFSINDTIHTSYNGSDLISMNIYHFGFEINTMKGDDIC